MFGTKHYKETYGRICLKAYSYQQQKNTRAAVLKGIHDSQKVQETKKRGGGRKTKDFKFNKMQMSTHHPSVGGGHQCLVSVTFMKSKLTCKNQVSAVFDMYIWRADHSPTHPHQQLYQICPGQRCTIRSQMCSITKMSPLTCMAIYFFNTSSLFSHLSL